MAIQFNIIPLEIIDDSVQDTVPNTNYIALLHHQNVSPNKEYEIANFHRNHQDKC